MGIRRTLLIAGPALVVSCTAPAPGPPPAAPVSPLPQSASAVVAPPAASGSAGLPSEDGLTKAQREELQELAVLCPAAVFHEEGRLEVGCTVCPSQSEVATDREPFEASRDDNRISPTARLRGSFTTPGADERLVVIDSCDCAGCPEDGFVLRAGEKGALLPVAKAPVWASSGCRLVRRANQLDRALCLREVARQGYRASVLSLYDFRNATMTSDANAQVFVFAAVDNTLLSCVAGAPFVRRSIASWELRDLDGDGLEDLRVELTVSDGSVTQAMARADCESAPGASAGRRVELRWTADSSGFKPTAQTASELVKLDKAAKAAGAQ